MGLDIGLKNGTSIGRAGSYSGFGKFRESLAGVIGMDLNAMQGFGGKLGWEKWIDHPLYTLLNHSDCDGEMTPKECAKVLKGIEEIQDGFVGRLEFWRKACEKAVKEESNLMFY